MKTKAIALSATTLFFAALLAGCGGGGGGAGVSQNAAAPPKGVYSLISPASLDIGPATAAVSTTGATLEASLGATTTVTVSERFYTTGRPAGAAGKIYDIKPDGLAFRPGTRLCISYENAGYAPNELTIVTGEALDQPVPSSVNAGRGSICAELSHSSPYGMRRATSLTIPDSTFFGNMRTKELYKYSVKSYSETDRDLGALSVVKIFIDCNFACVESGERIFKVASNGDLLILDNGAYPLWYDLEQLKWIHLKNEQGAITAGIPYLLAAAYTDYYVGGGPLSGFSSQLDPADNRIQRFFYLKDPVKPYLYVEIIREDSTSPGVIRAVVDRDGHPKLSYVIDRATAAITKTWISTVDGFHSVSAAPGDSAYNDLNAELLYYIYVLVGIEDTPDYTAGNAHDQYPRYTPNQELFAVNVMDLLKGLGWNNLQAIEAYYRDRLQAAQDPAK